MRAQDDTKHGDDISKMIPICFTLMRAYPLINLLLANPMQYAAAKRVADEIELSFNPLVLYGGVGLGKTHLMQAIALEIQKQDPRKRYYTLLLKKFMFQFIRAIRYKDMISFKEQFRSVDVLMIDDIQFIAWERKY